MVNEWDNDKRLNGPPYCDKCGKITTTDNCEYIGGHCDGYFHKTCLEKVLEESPKFINILSKFHEK